jgi:predicted Zn-dependent protease
MKTLDELEAVVHQALGEGARAAEVLCAQGEGRSIALSAGGKPTLKTTRTDVLTVRVWVDGGRTGRMRGPWVDRKELVGQALASTFESPEDPHAGPVGRLGSPAAGLGTADRRHSALTDADRLDALTDVERQIKATDSRFAPVGFAYDDERIWRGYASSRGIRMDEQGTRYRLEGGLTGMGLNLREHLEGRSFSTVASLPLGVQLVRRAVELLREGVTLPAGPVRVILPPLAMARLLAKLGEQFHPERLTGSGFFLQPDAHIRRALSDKLHVVDDGSAPGGLRTRAFDDRGGAAGAAHVAARGSRRGSVPRSRDRSGARHPAHGSLLGR